MVHTILGLNCMWASLYTVECIGIILTIVEESLYLLSISHHIYFYCRTILGLVQSEAKQAGQKNHKQDGPSSGVKLDLR